MPPLGRLVAQPINIIALFHQALVYKAFSCAPECSGQSPHLQWGPFVELCVYLQFYSGCDATDGHVGPVVVVSLEPFGCVFLSFLSRFNDVLIRPCVAQPARVTR